MEKVKYFLSIITFDSNMQIKTPAINYFDFSKNKQALREWANERTEYGVTNVEVFEITEQEYYYQQAKYNIRLARIVSNRELRLDFYHTAIRYTERYRTMLNQ